MSNQLCEECGQYEATFQAVFNDHGRNLTKNVCDRCYNKLYLSSNDATKSLYSKLSNNTKNIIFRARKEAKDRRHKEINNSHLMYAICLEQSFAFDILNSIGVQPAAIKQKIDILLVGNSDLVPRNTTVEPNISKEASNVFNSAVEVISKLEFQEIEPETLLIAILESKTETSDVLKRQFNLDVISILKEMEAQLTGGEDLVKKYKEAKSSKSALEKFSRNLNQLSIEGKLDPCIGRDKEVDRLVHILSRRTKNNCVLVGEPGVGKTAIAEGLAQRIVQYRVPKNLIDKKVIALDLNAMIAGTRFRGEFEERIKAVLDEVKEKSREIILFIDELHTLIGAGGNVGSMDAANVLKPSLARGELQCVGATTYEEYSQYIESDRALERRFQKLDVLEPTMQDAKDILSGIQSRYAKFHTVDYEKDSIDAAVELSIKFVPQRFLPDKAIDLLDEAGATVKLSQLKIPEECSKLKEEILEKKKKKEDISSLEKQLKDSIDKISTKKDLKVGKNDIAKVVSKWIGVPATEIIEEEKEKLLNLENVLHKTVIGQDIAIKSLCDAIRRSRVGITNQNRPIASVIFAGKTGVGKTLIAQTIAKQLFGVKENFIKLDMSEFQERHEVSKLIGAPPGYVGYDQGGALVEHVRRHPYSVVLFDEIEKAHPDIFNTLLQIMEDGVLTDGKGKKADFRNTVVIMTSNIAASEKNYVIGFTQQEQEDSYERLKTRTEKALKNGFKPEFLNRVDDILVFHELSKNDISKIVEVQLEELKNRVKDYKLEFVDLNKFIVKKGFSEEYGARSIRRWIQKNIENDLARFILEKNIQKGSEITISVESEKIHVS